MHHSKAGGGLPKAAHAARLRGVVVPGACSGPPLFRIGFVQSLGQAIANETGRVARSDTRADRDRERHLAARSALTGQTVAPGTRPLPYHQLIRTVRVLKESLNNVMWLFIYRTFSNSS